MFFSEMILNFMQYSPFPPARTIGGAVIERVATYKLLGVCISEDLSWNVHIEHIVNKANRRLYALCVLKKVASLPCSWCKCTVALFDLY